MLFKAVGADLQSAPLKYGSVIRLNVYTKGWIINPEQKSADYKSALAAASFCAYSEEQAI